MRIIRDYLLEIALAIVSIFLLLMVVLPYFSGFKIQSDYADLVKSVSQSTGLPFEVVSFQRHWFSSNARLVVKNNEKQILFEFKHKIIHGPLYLGLLLDGYSPLVNMVIKGTLLPGGDNKNLLSKVLSSKPVRINAYVGFNNDVSANVLVPSIDHRIDGVTFNTDVINLDLAYYSNGNRFKGEIKVPSLLAYEQSFIEVENFIISFDELVAGEGVAGDVVLSFDLLKLKLKQGVFDLRRVSSRLKNAMSNNILNIGLDINASKLNLFNEQVNSFSLGLAIDKFNILNINKDIALFSRNESVNENWFDFSQYDFDALKVDHFNFFSEHGTFTAAMVVKNDNERLLEQRNYFSAKNGSLDLSLNAALFQRIYEVVSINMSKPIKEAEVFIKSMLKLNYLDKNLDKLKLNISGKDNVFVINGQTVSFDDLSNNFMLNIFSN